MTSQRRERKIVTILGIKISSSNKSQLLKSIVVKASRRLQRGYQEAKRKPSLIVTPNPEIVCKAQKDSRLKKILNAADYSLPDGIGLVAAAKFLSLPKPKNKVLKPLTLLGQGMKVGLGIIFRKKWLTSELNTAPGRIMFEELIQEAVKRKLRVFLVGGKPGVASKAMHTLNRKWNLDNGKYSSGPWLGQNGKPTDPTQAKIEEKAIKAINKYKPHMLFVAFGPPKQEKWLARNLDNLNTNTAMVIGGTLDYFAGRAPFPPQLVSKLGLEWLWRSITQPHRLKRTFTSVVIFPLRVYLYRLKH